MTDHFQHHPQPRRPFIFADADQGNTAIAAKGNPDERSSRALEFIAMYLDRIETHLDRIAGQLEAGTANGEKVAASLGSLAHVLPRLMTGSR